MDQTPSQKIINLEIEEKATGEISAGAGIATGGGSISFSVKENNYMGKGIKLNANIALGVDTVRGIFAVTNPNFNYSDRALTSSIESTVTDRLSVNGYKTSKTGLAFNTSFEQYKDFYISTDLTSFMEKVDTNSKASVNLKKQDGNYFDTNFGYSLNYDKRNRGYQPTEGFRSLFKQSLPILADDKSIFNSYEYSAHHEFIDDMIGSFTFYTSVINSLNDDDVRISKRLYMPGKRLRGFVMGRIGPVDGTDYVGGNYLSALNISSTLPNFMATQENIDFRFFIDAANLWGVDYSDSINNSNKIRSSTGVGIDWFTPVGPLNFSLSQAITKADTDTTETFRFNLGTTF